MRIPFARGLALTLVPMALGLAQSSESFDPFTDPSAYPQLPGTETMAGLPGGGKHRGGPAFEGFLLGGSGYQLVSLHLRPGKPGADGADPGAAGGGMLRVDGTAYRLVNLQFQRQDAAALPSDGNTSGASPQVVASLRADLVPFSFDQGFPVDQGFPGVVSGADGSGADTFPWPTPDPTTQTPAGALEAQIVVHPHPAGGRFAFASPTDGSGQTGAFGMPPGQGPRPSGKRVLIGNLTTASGSGQILAMASRRLGMGGGHRGRGRGFGGQGQPPPPPPIDPSWMDLNGSSSP